MAQKSPQSPANYNQTAYGSQSTTTVGQGVRVDSSVVHVPVHIETRTPVYVESSTNYAPQPTAVYGPMFRGPDIDYAKSQGGIAKVVEAVSETIT